MNIHEYQAKALLQEYGVTVLRGQVAYTPDEAEAAARELGGPLWVVKAQIHAGGRGKGGGVKLAKSVEEVRQHADQMLGMTLVTHQTGPEGKQVRRVFVEDGCEIARELYLGVVIDRATSRVTLMASTEGGVEIEEVAARTPGEDHQGRDRPGDRLPAVPRPPDRLRPRPRGQARSASAVAFMRGIYRAFTELRRQPDRDQSAGGHRGRRAGGARRQDELRQQRALPPAPGGRAARPRRGGPARDRGQPPRAELHQARRQHRLHGQRRRPGDGDHGHHQAVTAARRPTSSTSAAAPPRSG